MLYRHHPLRAGGTGSSPVDRINCELNEILYDALAVRIAPVLLLRNGFANLVDDGFD